MNTPEQDRLAEIKQRAQRDERLGRPAISSSVPWVDAALADRSWLVGEVERLRFACLQRAEIWEQAAGLPAAKPWTPGGQR